MFIFLILINSLFSANYFIPKVTHYNVSNNNLKILALDDNDFVFYGENGGVLRTFDAGETWHQNYSGTDAYIRDMSYYNNVLYGVTDKGEIIISNDKGDFWKTYNVTNEPLISIAINDDIIYVCSNNGNIYISLDFGLNWTKSSELNGIVQKLIYYDGSIFAQLIDENSISSLKVLKNGDDSFKEYDLPNFAINKYFQIHLINEVFYLTTYENFAILESENNWNIHNLSIVGNYKFYPKDENKIIFAYPSVTSALISFFEYDMTAKNLKLIASHRNLALGLADYLINDLCFIDGELFVTMPGKTIIKSNDLGENIEILSSLSRRGFSISTVHIIDDNNWVIPRNGESIAELSATIFKTTNGGKTFYKNENSLPVDTSEHNYPIYPVFDTSFFKDMQIGAFTLKGVGGSTMFPFNFGKTNDGGSTFQFKFDSNYVGRSYNTFNYKDEFYLTSTLLVSRRLNIYKINKEFEIELIGYVDSVGTNLGVKFFMDEENLWIYGQDRTNKNYFIAKSNPNDLKCDKLYVEDSPGFLGGFYMYKQNDRYFFYVQKEESVKNTEIFELNTSSNKLELIYSPQRDKYPNVEFEYFIPINGTNYLSFGDVKDNIFIHRYITINGTDTTKYRNLVKINFDDKLNVDTLYKLDPNITVSNELIYQQLTENYSTYYTSIANIYVPMEKDRIEYYSSVENKVERNYLYVHPPFPQPSNRQVKIKVFWDIKQPFTIDDISIYSLNGKKINTYNQLRIEKVSVNSAYIIWGNESQEPGIYIVKIEHGTETRFEKILIIR